MSLPIQCVPPVVNGFLSHYRGFFTKPQFANFSHLVSGLIVSDNKTIQEINDGFGVRDQSSLNRFVSHSSWDLSALNSVRLEQIKDSFSFRKKGVLIIDESLLHKTGKHMELAGSHRSGITKRIEWGHMIVNAFYTDVDNNAFPVETKVYVREKDCEKFYTKFKTKRELGLEEVDTALNAGLPVGLVITDAGYEGQEFTNALKERGLDFLVGVRTTTKMSIDREKRISVGEYLESLEDKDFMNINVDGHIYFYHIKQIYMRGIGRIKLVISHPAGDAKKRCYITNLKTSNKTIIKLLTKRWEIECFHRDAKQHLGLEAYQVRKSRGMQVVALASLIAYTLVILAMNKLKTPRPLRTIGEGCRYLALVAYKGINWIRKKIREKLEWRTILNKHVFVKNAKV